MKRILPLVLLVIASAAVADDSPSVLLRVENYWTVPVNVQVGSGTASYSLQRPIPKSGSLVMETKPNSTIVFSKGKSGNQKYTATDEAVQMLRLGDGVKRTLKNATTDEISVFQVFVDATNPDQLSQKHLFDIPPGSQHSASLFYNTALRFLSKNVPLEADYIVKSEDQDNYHVINKDVPVVVENLRDGPVSIAISRGTNSTVIKLAAKSKTNPLSLSVGSKLSFTVNGRQVAKPFEVLPESSPVIRIPWRYDNDPEWHDWVTSTGDYTNFELNKKISPYDNSIFLEQFPSIQKCMIGYNIVKLNPRNLGDEPGSRRLPIFCSLEKPEAELHWRYAKDGSQKLMPNYLSLKFDTGKKTSDHTVVYSNESQRRNAWAASVKVPELPGGFSFNQSSSNATSSSSLNKESVEISWSLWVSVNKSEIVLDPKFVARVLQLENSSKADYERFFDDFGTHYPLATLFGGIQSTSVKESINGSQISSETAEQFITVDHSSSSSSSQSTTTIDEKTELYGTMTEEQRAMMPVHVVFAPIDELIRPQLFDERSVGSIQKSMKAELARYLLRGVGERDELHIFKVTTHARMAPASLYLYDCRDATPRTVNGFPVSHVHTNGEPQSTLVVADSGQFIKNNKFAAFFATSPGLQADFAHVPVRVPSLVVSSETFPNKEKGFIGAERKAARLQEMIYTTSGKSLSVTGVAEHSIELSDVVRLRKVYDSIRALAMAKDNKDVKYIESTRAADATARKDSLQDRIEQLNDKRQQAKKRNLSDYADLLAQALELEQRCTLLNLEYLSLTTLFPGKIDGIYVSLSIEDVTRLSDQDFQFPPPPTDIENWLEEQKKQ